MDDRYIEAVARHIAAEAERAPRRCETCGGHDVIVAAMPIDPSIGAPFVPITYCRSCDAGSPEAVEVFETFDRLRTDEPDE
ncbi:MAG TPA: hypothetical protein VNW94_23900 [Streptosporangiaceae bacterium]|nr:hypothetical protein [Streptosporangiaceae bacterium]